MGQRQTRWHCVLFLLSIFLFSNAFASDKDYQLQIHVHYQAESDSWQVNYQLPIAVDHVAFSRQSNFDRRKVYRIDESKFKWEQDGDTLLLRSIDGKAFRALSLNFSSFYDFIKKDYAHNKRYSDGSVLLYTQHLALGANVIEDKTKSPIGASFEGTQFHFYSPNQHIAFLGNRYKNKAQWQASGQGTYVYFGNIPPLETNSMIAIVDPALPQWVWRKTEQYFPRLFDYYTAKTGQSLTFKPIVFLNYEPGDGAHYDGGTLDGLVQLTIKGQQWQTENKAHFNHLFHFLAHESAHFWNGQMYALEEQQHAWLHEGGADTFANLAMRDFGLINEQQMLKKFEDAANQCFLNKGAESLEQSAKLWRFDNYYTCGAAMGLATHVAVKEKNAKYSVFDVWQHIFNATSEQKKYDQQDYFNALDHYTGSNQLSKTFEKFIVSGDLNNQHEVVSWFNNSHINTNYTQEYPQSITQYWGRRIIYHLMNAHCNGLSFSTHRDYIQTYPIEGCEAFKHPLKIQFLDDIDILKDGVAAYKAFQAKCDNAQSVVLKNREKSQVATIKCLHKVAAPMAYLQLRNTL